MSEAAPSSSGDRTSEAGSAEATGDQQCPPCRGTGAVISALGGETTSVRCPWCEGSAVLLAGHDAQAGWRA